MTAHGAKNVADDLLGAHVSTAGGVSRAPANGSRVGCRTIQVFTRNQRRWRARPISAGEIAGFRSELVTCGIRAALSHGSYLLNLAARGPLRGRSCLLLLDEWDRAEALGLLGVCFHPGAHLGAGVTRGLGRVTASLNAVARRRARHRSLLLIENTAGQGTTLGASLGELAAIFGGLEQPERFGLCLDTCHLFAAGHDLRDARSYHRTFEALDRQVGLGRVRAFHLNDSKRGLASRVDRHEQIGRGHLGDEPFRLLLGDGRFLDVPKVLETPGGPAGFRRALGHLRRLAGRPRRRGP